MKRQSNDRFSKYKLLFVILGIFAAMFILMFYTHSPLLKDFRNSIYALFLEKGIIYAIIAYVCFRRDSRLPNICKAILFLFPTITLILSLLSLGRISYLIILIYGILCIGVYAYYKVKRKKDYSSLMYCGLLSYIQIVVPILSVEYIDSEFPFWIPSLIICIIACIVCLFISFRKYNKDKLNPKIRNKSRINGELISINILVLMMGFILPWMTISSLNVVLDNTEPKYEVFEVVDKDIRTGNRRITTYNLELEKGDIKINIAVSEVVYYEYEVGEKITVSIYNGAFNERYYTYDR